MDFPFYKLDIHCNRVDITNINLNYYYNIFHNKHYFNMLQSIAKQHITV